ncbi:MAG: hypothetical protein K5653_02520 [Clostridiales bacterium]|nr:hypothetical protein [Clostridiales bacterium]
MNNDTKFSMNALMVVVIIFAAIAFFFTVKMVDLADRWPVNEFYKIEDTDYAVRYSNLEPNGIYKGSEAASSLVVEGTFGYDWGVALEGDKLYINEYVATNVGLTLCDLVAFDMDDMSKQVIAENTLLRGRCKSGELVLMGDYIMPSNNPDVNSLCKFYSMSSPSLAKAGERATVIYLDPATGQVLLSLEDKSFKGDSFDNKYLDRTLDEVKAEAGAAASDGEEAGK